MVPWSASGLSVV